MEGILDFAALVSFLEANKFPHAVNRELQVVELPSKADPLIGNLIIKWEKKFPFFNMIQFMIENVPEARIPDVETAIIRLNCSLEIPGLGFDHTTRRIFFRLTIPIFGPQGIAPSAFNQLGQGCVRQAKDLYPGMKAILDGRPGAEILTIAGEAAAAARKANQPPQGDLA